MAHFLKKSRKDKIVKDIKTENTNSNNLEKISEEKSFFTGVFANIIIVGFISLLLIFILNSISAYHKGKDLEKEISEKAFEGISLLLEGGKKTSQIQLKKAKESFIEAGEHFDEAKSKAWFAKSDKSVYGKNNDFNNAITGLLDGGIHFSNAGSYFLEAMDEFNLIPFFFVTKNKTPEKAIPSLTDTLRKGLEKTDLAILEIEKANERISSVNQDLLPDDLKIKLVFAKEKISEITEILNNIQKYYPALFKILGENETHKILVLFQNNQEMRPTGGFIGSFGIIHIKDGFLEKLETHDVYDLWGAVGMKIEAPEDLHLYTTNWRFRDSNYSADFPLSAEKAIWFLELEGGFKVDTVIAINQGLLKDLLEITGPIQVGKFAKLNSYNYDTVLSYVIESKMWGAEDPKHILKVFVDAFAKEIMQEKYISKVSGKLLRAVEQKHIMFYSKDAEIMDLFDQLGVSGRQYRPKPDEDYISVINLSSGGTKSDKLIEERITHRSKILEDNSIENTLTIKRTHLYNDSVLNKWKEILSSVGINRPENYVFDILGRGRNRNSMQIYVPKGSVLLKSNDPELKQKFDNELDKTYFFTTVELQAGQSKEISITYKLPFKISFDEKNYGVYKLVAEKMPGNPGQLFTKVLEKSEKIIPILSYPENLKTNPTGELIYAKDLVYDRYFSALLQKQIEK